jgi:integrase
MASIRRRADKWQVQIRRAGSRPISKTFTVRKDALEWARDRERQADRGDLPKDSKVLKELTLGDLIRRYQGAVSIHKAGYENECIVFKAFLKHPICRKTLAELRTEDFAEYRDIRLKTIKATTLKRQLSPVHNALEVAREEWGLPLKINPLDGLKLKLKDKRRERRLLPGEQERLLAATTERRTKLITPIIVFALATAMRRGEILAMKWTDVDVQRRSLLIPETKNGDSRVIPLSRQAIAVLNLLPRTGQKVFPVSANAVRLSWTRLTKRAQLKNLHFHDLRHEAISRFFELGLTVPEVALISGHKDLRMLFRYAHAARQVILAKLEGKERKIKKTPQKASQGLLPPPQG